MRVYYTEDLTGRKFGMLTVIKRDVGNDYIYCNGTRRKSRWICKCQCGSVISAIGDDLKRGKTWCCGCKYTGKFKDLTGQRFGKLTVLKMSDEYRISPKYQKRQYLWICKCDCGNITTVTSHSLRSGHTTSCGCNIIEAATKHGKYGTRIYNIYLKMCARCRNSNVHEYENYGGKGIKVCDEWSGENGFINFYNWAIANGYNDKLTIDRIDPNKDYCPKNCRWTDYTAQANNRKSNIYMEYNGETHTLAEWAIITGIPYLILHNRHVDKHLDSYKIIYPGNKFIEISNSSGESHSLEDWSHITGISHDTLYNRIILNGWNIDRALSTPEIDPNRLISYDGTAMNCRNWDIARGFAPGTTLQRLNSGLSIEASLSIPTIDNDGNKNPINAIYFVDDNGNPIKE